MAYPAPAAPAMLASLYEQDFVAWADQVAARLRAGHLDALDWEQVAEEIEGLSRSDRREAEARLRLILTHLLKWQVQPARPVPSWRDTLMVQRRDLGRLLRRAPSLRHHLEATWNETYADARLDAGIETGLGDLPASFPRECPYTLAQLLDPSYLPR